MYKKDTHEIVDFIRWGARGRRKRVWTKMKKIYEKISLTVSKKSTGCTVYGETFCRNLLIFLIRAARLLLQIGQNCAIMVVWIIYRLCKKTGAMKTWVWWWNVSLLLLSQSGASTLCLLTVIRANFVPILPRKSEVFVIYFTCSYVL